MIAQHIDDYFRQELIYKRNLRMAERVDELLKSQPDRSFFFAFGAGICISKIWPLVINTVQEKTTNLNIFKPTVFSDILLIFKVMKVIVGNVM